MPSDTQSAVGQGIPPAARTSAGAAVATPATERGDAGAPRPFTFTVDDAHAICETGIFRGKRVELVGGQFIVKEPGAPSHSGKVDRLTHLLYKAVEETAIVRVQNPLRISDIDLPEPDLAILRRRDDFYENAHPEPTDVLLVIEVANTSLRYDQSTKASLYAAAGIGTYWIVDVNAETVCVHTDPSDEAYENIEIHERGNTLTIPVPTAPSLPVSDLFPEPEQNAEDAPGPGDAT